MNKYDTLQQYIYLLNMNIIYPSTSSSKLENIKVLHSQISYYEISKDSVNNDHNNHLITISGISDSVRKVLENDKTKLQLQISENNKIISDKIFIIKKIHIETELDGMYVLKIMMISEMVNDFLKSSKFAKASLMNNEAVSLYKRPFDTLSAVLNNISTTFGSELNTHYNDAGYDRTLSESIRIPETLNDIEIFNYLFQNYPPYLLNPYFILDDLYDNSAPYNLIITNLININNNYNLKNVKYIQGINLKQYTYQGSKPLINFSEIKDYLTSTIILKNPIENKVYEIKPAFKDNREEKTRTIESPMSIESFKDKLYLLSSLAYKEATYETYWFKKINIFDVSFLNVYNITDSKIYDHIPISIEYIFSRNSNNNFDLDTIVRFIKMPEKLLTGGNKGG